MKKALLAFIIIAFAGAVHAQQKANWNEMEEFHKVMSQTFHPAEEGKMEPIKTRSGEMLQKAIAWKNSTAPEGYDKKAVMKNLKKLVKGSKEVDRLVQKNATDAEIKKGLAALHDVFHAIVEKCEKE